MYKKISTDKEIKTINNSICKPVATLANEYGGKIQIIIDDNCYLVLLKCYNKTKNDEFEYKILPWINNEVLDVLKELPKL